MPELPPQSRVISRIDGEILSITLPRSPARIGCIGGSWAGAAVFGFLAICSFAQGTFSGNLIWTGAGFFFFLFTGWQLLALRGGILRAPGTVKLEIAPESFAIVSGPADTPHRRSWPRSAITGIRVEPKKTAGPTSLFLELRDEPRSVCLYSGSDAEEMEWIAEQIRKRLSGGDERLNHQNATSV